MRLSRNAHYALRAVLDLGQRSRSHAAEIAKRQSIPSAHLAKIVQSLSRRGLVRTYRGARGGVQLARPGSAVTLRDLVEAVEGPIEINQCLVWGDCPCLQPCPVRAALARVQMLVEHELESISLESLAAHR